MAVICDLLGIPREDEPLFRNWGRVALSTVHSNEDKGAYMQKMIAYLIPLIERERTHPSNTILGTLVKARSQWRGTRPLNALWQF